MSFSSSHEDTSGSSTTSLDPLYASAVYGNYNRAPGLANTPFQPYSGEQVTEPAQAPVTLAPNLPFVAA